MIERGPGWELRLGDWRDVLADVERVDAVICDPPYLGACESVGAGGVWKSPNPRPGGSAVMEYKPADEKLLADLVAFARRTARGWFVVFNDFDGTAFLRDVVKCTDGIAAEPIAWVKPPSMVPARGSVYLPTKGTEFVLASRWFREKAKGRYLPGSYVSPRNTPSTNKGTTTVVTGGKPLALMRAIVRDHSEPGDLVCDPAAGGATTLLAAVIEGRRAIGAERDPVTFAKAVKRLRAGYTPTMFGDEARERRT